MTGPKTFARQMAFDQRGISALCIRRGPPKIKPGIQGIVILEAVITKTGTVEDVRVLRALHPILDQAAISAVKQWKYQPAMLNGRPVKVYFTVTVNFTLR